MFKYRVISLIFYFVFMGSFSAIAADISESSVTPPWGHAKNLAINYQPQKLLYDLTTSDPKKLDNILDRASYLFKLYDSEMFDSSIVIIIHGEAIPFFAIDQLSKYKEQMIRANSLTIGTTIEFRMCKAAAKLMNYKARDIHGFVTMVPMADAEIVRLQKEEGYAYMR